MSTPTRGRTVVFAGLYVFSGICQPLIMNVCKDAGLADSGAQLYMFFYYLGPAALIVTLIRDHYWRQDSESQVLILRSTQQQQSNQPGRGPSTQAILKASGIAVFDIVAQALNYTGGGMAGSTIFALIYSSVTIWTALWSRLILSRSLSWIQWLAIFIVFGGLTVTALDSVQLGTRVLNGAILILFGSAMHGATYVLSEAIMNRGYPEDRLTIRQNAAIQALLATLALGLWQLFYTVPRWDIVIGTPAKAAGTTLMSAAIVMLSFSAANLVHALTFYHTLKHYPGGATSAGVMKGLQAVLVFVATHLLFCRRSDGRPEMCFSVHKFASLVVVTTGVALFGVATEHLKNSPDKRGYSTIVSVVVDEEQD